MGLLMVTRGHGPTRGAMRGAIDGGNIWWIAPSYPVASDIWRDLKRACKDAWTDKSELERRIELPGGGAVTVKSADNPDSLRGSGLDGVVLDEAASVKPEVWRESIRPALSDKQGWAVFIGTPKGFNWFHDLFQQAAHLPGWARWQRSSLDNPLLTQTELDGARNEIGSLSFSQEYLAEFLADGLGMFKREWFQTVPSIPPHATNAVRYWDKAATQDGGDYSAGVLVVEYEGMFFIEHIVRGQWSPHKRNQVIEETAHSDNKRFPRMVTWFEEEGGSGGKESAAISREQMRKLGYLSNSERVTDPKNKRAADLAAECEAGHVRIIREAWNAAFVDELCIFPNGINDDQVDAASGAVRKVRKPRRSLNIEFIGR